MPPDCPPCLPPPLPTLQAWGSSLIGCRIFRPSPDDATQDVAGQTGNIIDCIEWCMAQGAAVSCNSWGFETDAPPQLLHDVIAEAGRQGGRGEG